MASGNPLMLKFHGLIFITIRKNMFLVNLIPIIYDETKHSKHYILDQRLLKNSLWAKFYPATCFCKIFLEYSHSHQSHITFLLQWISEVVMRETLLPRKARRFKAWQLPISALSPSPHPHQATHSSYYLDVLVLL